MSKITAENIDFMEEWFAEKYQGNYQMHISKYSVRFVNGKDKVVLCEEMNPEVFRMYNKLKKHILENPKWQDIKESRIRFNGYDNKLFLDTSNFKDCINIDIKGAYPSALLSLGLINDNIYQQLLRLPKLDRLKAIGMSARKSCVFNFKDGVIDDYYVLESDVKNIYFAAAYKVEVMMNELKAIADKHFIFTWVDGIFLKPTIPEVRLDKMIEVLNRNGFSSTKMVIDLDIVRDGNKLNIKTIKDGSFKEFKFRDIYFKKINKDLIEKLHQRYCETH
jgi:hypothetical protein